MGDQIIHTQSPSSSTANQVKDTEAGSQFTDFPDDLIIEILTWLPAKSLSRFKCVSISWLSLISSPQFVRTHHCINSDSTRHKVIVCPDLPSSYLQEFPVSSALYGHDTEASSVEYPVGYQMIEQFEIVGSCHGLLCVSIPAGGIIMWNPSMRKCRRLPDFNAELGRYSWSNNRMLFGYGYDEANDDYKVVEILHVLLAQNPGLIRGITHEFHVKMYSSKLNCWRRIENFQGGYPFGERGYFASGKLHWMATPTLGPSDHEHKIVSIDLASGMYGDVESPEFEKFPSHLSYSELGIVGGCLSVFCYYQVGSSAKLDVWVMKDYGVAESWARLASVDYSEYLAREIYAAPVFFSKEGEFLFKYGTIFALTNAGHDSLTVPRTKVSFDSRYDSLAYPRIRNLKRSFRWADVYVESLVWPNAREEGGAANQTGDYHLLH